MKTIIILITLLFIACEPEGPEDTVVFVDAQIDEDTQVYGSGFIVAGQLITANHVVRDALEVHVWTQDGEEIDVGPFVRKAPDVAMAEVLSEHDVPGVDVAELRGMKRGCLIGRPNAHDFVSRRCGKFFNTGDVITVTMHENAEFGMSGGPCFVDGSAVGMISRGTAPKRFQKSPGVTFCRPLTKEMFE